MTILEKILVSKRAELGELRKARLPVPPSGVPSLQLERAARTAESDEAHSPLHLLCEIKKKSPSAGTLSTRLSVAQRAKIYGDTGASLISVLCDGPFFDGSYEDLLEARSLCKTPLLCKEFVIDECQLDAAAAYGASAVLLIVRCLPGKQLETLIAAARQRKLEPLVEVFKEDECERALDSGATFIGVNARDLDTLEMDSARAARVIESLPSGIVSAHLSGVKTPDDVTRVAQGSANAALIGEVLMRADDPSDLLARLVQAARG